MALREHRNQEGKKAPNMLEPDSAYIQWALDIDFDEDVTPDTSKGTITPSSPSTPSTTSTTPAEAEAIPYDEHLIQAALEAVQGDERVSG